MGDDMMLRVHSNDLHHHIVEEVGKCLESGAFTDVAVRCKGGQVIHAHKLVLSAVSPYIKSLLEWNEYEEVQTLELPDVTYEEGILLIDVIYNGAVEATLDELRCLVLLARMLYISIPVSNDLLATLEIPAATAAQRTFNGNKSQPPKLYSSLLPPPMKMHQKSLYKRPPTVLSQQQQPKSGEVNGEVPLPPPLKRIREDLPHLQIVHNRTPLLPLSSQQQQQQGKPGNKEYLCPFCNSKYNNVTNFKMHMRFHENEAVKEERNHMINEMVAASFNHDTNLYTCEICQSTYSHPGNFKQHLGKHERESGAVSVLYQERFPQHELLPGSAVTSPPLLHPAMTSSPKINSNSHLNHALQSSFADRVDNGDPSVWQYHCEICGRTFKHPGNFKQHMSSHMKMTISGPAMNAELNGVAHKCDICDEVLVSEESLRAHKATFHDPINTSAVDPLEAAMTSKSGGAHLFSCDHPGCMQSFSKEVFLKKHKENSHGFASSFGDLAPFLGNERPLPTFQCKVCGKAFFKMAKLTAHMKIHSAPEEHYRHACSICHKKFTRPQHVNRHMRLHTGERPFQCEKCDKAFNREDKLKQHLHKGCDVTGHSVEGNEEDDTYPSAEDSNNYDTFEETEIKEEI